MFGTVCGGVRFRADCVVLSVVDRSSSFRHQVRADEVERIDDGDTLANRRVWWWLGWLGFVPIEEIGFDSVTDVRQI